MYSEHFNVILLNMDSTYLVYLFNVPNNFKYKTVIEITAERKYFKLLLSGKTLGKDMVFNLYVHFLFK